MIRLHWAGESNIDIAARTGFTPTQVCNVLSSPEAQAILAEISASAFDSTKEVGQKLQLAAEEALDVKISLLHCGDLRVENSASTDLLYMAGHSPTKRIHVTGPSAVEKEFEGLSDEEIRQKVLSEFDDKSKGNGPDGRPLS
jgi:hypothetical protein